MDIPQSIKQFAEQLINLPNSQISAGSFVTFKIDDTEYKGVVIGYFINAFTNYRDTGGSYKDIIVGDIVKSITLKIWTTDEEEFSVHLDQLTLLKDNPFTD